MERIFGYNQIRYATSRTNTTKLEHVPINNR
jgi:hypothetical protein